MLRQLAEKRRQHRSQSCALLLLIFNRKLEKRRAFGTAQNSLALKWGGSGRGFSPQSKIVAGGYIRPSCDKINEVSCVWVKFPLIFAVAGLVAVILDGESLRFSPKSPPFNVESSPSNAESPSSSAESSSNNVIQPPINQSAKEGVQCQPSKPAFQISSPALL